MATGSFFRNLGLSGLLLAALMWHGCAAGDVPGAASTSCIASFTGPEVSAQEVAVDNVIEYAISFALTASSAPAKVQLKLKAIGAPTGNLILKIEGNSSSGPDGLVLENTTLAASTVSAAVSAYYTFTFAVPQTLPIGTYWIILKGNSTFSATVGVSWMASNVAGIYTGGATLFSNNDTTWSSSLLNGRAFLFLLGC